MGQLELNFELELKFEECLDDIEKAYNRLKGIVGGLAESGISSEDYMKYYTSNYNVLCMRNRADDQDSKGGDYYARSLYERYRERLEDYVTSVVVPAIENKRDIELMLRELAKQWQNYNYVARWFRRFFYYLERFYIARRLVPTLQEVNIDVFHGLCYKELNVKARDAVIILIDKEREGEVIDKSLLKKVLEIFVDMGMRKEASGPLCYYEEDFEQHMIKDTGSYYSRKASSWIAEDSCPDYMKKAEECLNKEKERVSHYLRPSSERKLTKTVQHELLVVHHMQLLENEHSGCRALLRGEKVDDLSRMLRLFREPLEGKLLKPMGDIFQQHITQEGKDLVQQLGEATRADDQSANKNQMQICFQKIIELHDKFKFLDHKVFDKALKDGFEVFCNKAIAGASIVELLATFCDNLIKNSDTETAVEETLEKVAKLLVHFHDKDLFGEFHRKKLARRLLLDRNSGAKDDINVYDRSFISKLKEHYGGCFTSKMESMSNDVILAKDTQRKLENWFGSNPSEKPNYDLSVKILTTGCWPSFNSSDLNLPAEMVKGVEAFKKFYEKTTNGRKLTWVYSLGNCHINGRFEQKTIELIVSTYQAAALLLFNDADTLTFSEIHTQLNLKRDDLVRVLHSLSCARHKILNKEPKTKSISETDSFEFNSKFTDRMRRIKIPLPHAADERKKTTEAVNQERKHQIDAALVRIMKSRKVLGHQQLVSECVELLSKTFKPDIKAIKRRIEDLISREFLERDSNNPSIFKYLP